MRLQWIILIVLAAAAVAVIAIGVAIFRAYRGILVRSARRRDLEALAGAHGLKFVEGGRWEPPVQCLHMPLFCYGYGREARDVLAGQVAGQPAMIFEYECCTGSGRKPHVQLFHAALLKMPIEAPRLVVRSAHLTDAVAHLLNLEQIEMESEEFNRRYHVLCADRKFAFDICHPVVMAALLDGETVPMLEMDGRFLLMYDGPHPPKDLGCPRMAERFLEVGRHILQSIPEYVRHDRGTAQKAGGQP